MIRPSISVKGSITPSVKIKGELHRSVVKELPELEDLEVTPSSEEQNFKSDKYGFDNVKVNAVEGEEIIVTPSNKDQIKEGMFNKVTVSGDENLIPENISKGKSIFGVEGVAESRGEENAVLNDELFKTESITSNFSPLTKMITKLPEEIDLANWTKTTYMFSNFHNLLEVPKMNTSKITDMKEMFNNCKKITTIPQLDTSKVTNMTQMFDNCQSLTTVPQLDTSNVTTMYRMFNYCQSLTTAPQLDTSKVTDMRQMFSYCTTLTTIPQLDASNVTNMSSCMSDNYNLTTHGGLLNLGKGYTQKTNNYSNYYLSLTAAKLLTHESLMNIINNLYDLNITYDVANGGTLYTQQLYLGNENRAKLTPDEIAIATNKGWTVL